MSTVPGYRRKNPAAEVTVAVESNRNTRGKRLTFSNPRWDNPTMIVTLDSKRRLTVPASLVPTTPGEYFDAHFDVEEDAIVFRRLPKKGKEDWISVLKECPVSMDDIPARRRERARHRNL